MRVRLTLLATIAAAALFAVPGTSSAASSGVLVCNGTGELRAQNGTPATWEVSGKGSCLDATLNINDSRPRQVEFTGTGTSDTLGLCTPGALLVRNLEIDVTMEMTDVFGTTTFTETWRAPITLFPLITPFLIDNSSGNSDGLGVVLHRIALRCGNSGRSPSALFAWLRG